MATVTLYDLACRGHNACWSLNPWKTRLALNYKGITYDTKFLEYPELKPYFESLNFAPTGDKHTIPVICLHNEDGKDVFIQDSANIIKVLEQHFPEPSLRSDAPEVGEVQQLLGQAMAPLRAVLIPKVAKNVLNEASIPYFEQTREKIFGMSLEEVAKTKGGESAWEAAREGWEKMEAWLERNDGGVFVLGSEGESSTECLDGVKQLTGVVVSYADFIIVSAIEWVKRTDEADFGRLVGEYPLCGKLHEACKPWLERDDH